MKHLPTLQKRILYISVSLILVPITLYSVFVVSTTVRFARESFANYMVFTMKKVGAAVDNVFSELDRASLFIIASYDITNYLSVPSDELIKYPDWMFSAYNQQRYAKSSSDFIRSVQIKGFNTVVLASGPISMHITQDDVQLATQHKGQAFWNIEQDPEGKYYIYLCRLINHPQDPKNNLGVTKLYLDTQVLQKLISIEKNSASYYLMDGSGKILSSVNPVDGSLPAKDFSPLNLVSHSGKSFTSQINNKRYYVAPYTISSNGWMLIMVEQPTVADQQVVASIALLTSLTVLCLVLCFYLADILSRITIKPLNEVMHKMKSIENEDFAARIDVKGDDEIAELANQFNQMASKINSLVDEVYKADIRKKEAELRALQAQINPHFLYNTLDMVYWTAKMEDAPETSDLISSLSHFFRSAFNPTGEYTTVYNELEHLRYYVILIQQRKNYFDFNLEIDPDTSDCKTVKLVLQPLVENSIIHGIGNKENGQINVLIQHRDNQLIYVIEDNGTGINVADIEQLMVNPLSSARGFGLRNVNDRISLAFGPEYGLHFNSKPEGGTIVTVVLPYIKE
jgi:two-component system, sensor histidine kinase YesM